MSWVSQHEFKKAFQVGDDLYFNAALCIYYFTIANKKRPNESLEMERTSEKARTHEMKTDNSFHRKMGPPIAVCFPLNFVNYFPFLCFSRFLFSFFITICYQGSHPILSILKSYLMRTKRRDRYVPSFYTDTVPPSTHTKMDGIIVISYICLCFVASLSIRTQQNL